MVSSQLYFTINLEEIFYFNDKKYRIYAVFGVSQTPMRILLQKETIKQLIQLQFMEQMPLGKVVSLRQLQLH